MYSTSSDNGATWSAPAFALGGLSPARTIHGNSDDFLWTVMRWSNASYYTGHIWSSHDGGVTWQKGEALNPSVFEYAQAQLVSGTTYGIIHSYEISASTDADIGYRTMTVTW